MNINNLRKNYDQLTAAERFNLILEAGAREDEQELTALVESAPKVGYNITQHFLRASAADHLAALHLAMVFGQGCAFLLGFGIIRLTDDGEEPERFNSIYDSMRELAKQLITYRAAWRAWCEAEGINPDKLLDKYPGYGTDQTDTYPLLFKFANTLDPDEPDPEEVRALVESLAVIFDRLGGNA